MNFSCRYFFVVFSLLVTLLGFAPKSHAGDLITLKAVAEWIVQQTKGVVEFPQAIKITRIVFDQANTNKIDPFLMVAVMSAESGFNQKASSKYGAKGLMQVVPRWHRDKIRGRNIHDPTVNVEVGAKILNDCLVQVNDRIRSGLRCYSGGAAMKYEARIAANHRSLKEAVIEERFMAQAPIVATAAFQRPRYWHEQMDRYDQSLSRDKNTSVATNDYERLLVALQLKDSSTETLTRSP